MSALDWFKRILGQPGEAAAQPPADASMELAGLNFMTAIEAHIKWKSRLESYIQGTSTEDLKVEVICRDDQCPLGKWIYSAGGERFGTIDTFGTYFAPADFNETRYSIATPDPPGVHRADDHRSEPRRESRRYVSFPSST